MCVNDDCVMISLAPVYFHYGSLQLIVQIDCNLPSSYPSGRHRATIQIYGSSRLINLLIALLFNYQRSGPDGYIMRYYLAVLNLQSTTHVFIPSRI